MTPKAEILEKRISRLEGLVNPRPELDALGLMRQRAERIRLLLGSEPYTPSPGELERINKLRRWLEG